MGTRETTQVVSNFNLETKGVKKINLFWLSCHVKWNDLTVGMWHKYMTWVHDMLHGYVT